MAKRVHKNDSTMDVSVSQLVAESPAPPAPGRRISNPANDASVWKQVVVGTDDFAPAPSQRTGGRPWLILAVAGVLVAAGGGGGYALYASRGDTPAPVAASVPEPTASEPIAVSAAADASPVVVAPAVVETVAEPAMIVPDAISSVGAPIPRKEKRKNVATKKSPKKKPATKPSAPAPKRTNR